MGVVCIVTGVSSNRGIYAFAQHSQAPNEAQPPLLAGQFNALTRHQIMMPMHHAMSMVAYLDSVMSVSRGDLAFDSLFLN